MTSTSLINHGGHFIFGFCNRAMHPLQFTALVQSDISSPVVQSSLWRFVPIIQTHGILAATSQETTASTIAGKLIGHQSLSIPPS